MKQWAWCDIEPDNCPICKNPHCTNWDRSFCPRALDDTCGKSCLTSSTCGYYCDLCSGWVGNRTCKPTNSTTTP